MLLSGARGVKGICGVKINRELPSAKANKLLTEYFYSKI